MQRDNVLLNMDSMIGHYLHKMSSYSYRNLIYRANHHGYWHIYTNGGENIV